ncbi:MAG: Poxvirus G6 [Planctomycetes bacterium]|nr:Poxvirus G6 [Planctomycetota bacterium]
MRVTGAALSAAAALELYDSYLDTCAQLAAHDALRKILDRGDSGVGTRSGQLDGLTRDYLDLARRYRTHDTLEFLREHLAAFESGDDPHLAWLRERIRSSPSFRTLRQHWLIPLPEFAGETVNLVASDLKRLGDATMGGTSKGFGNAVGAVQFRRGKLHGDPAVESAIRQGLQPGDILLEKTPFRLTDRFIPGHWGHVAIWMGSDTEVRAVLGDDPLLAPHAARLATGAGVCEALRDGVQLNPLSRFLDIDDICVLRQPGLPRDELAAILRRSLRQLGKAYDFNFDVETADRIVCSELAYQVYTGIAWPTGKTLGRWTISPDQVAVRAIDGGPLQVVELWHDGRRLDGDLQAELKRLLAAAR